MILPTNNDISIVIRNLKSLKQTKQEYWKAYATEQKYGDFNDSKEQQLQSNYVQPVLDRIMGDFERFGLYGYIITDGSKKWKTKKSINRMLKGCYSTESDSIAINEIIKELETVKQYLERQQPTNDNKKPDLANKTQPTDLMTLTVTTTKYDVHPLTIRRAIKDGKLKNYQRRTKPKNAPILVSASEVERYYPPVK